MLLIQWRNFGIAFRKPICVIVKNINKVLLEIGF